MKNKSIFIFAFVFFVLLFNIVSVRAYNFPHIFSRPKSSSNAANEYYPIATNCGVTFGFGRPRLIVGPCAAIFQNGANNININMSDQNGVLNISEYPGILVAAGGGGVFLLKGGGYTKLYGDSPYFKILDQRYNILMSSFPSNKVISAIALNPILGVYGQGGAAYMTEIQAHYAMENIIRKIDSEQSLFPLLNITYTDATGVVRYDKKYWKVNIIASKGHEPVITLVNQKLQDLSRQQKVEFGDFVSHIKTLIAK